MVCSFPGEEFGVVPGAEFRAAAMGAEAVGARLVLGDRNIVITAERVEAAISGWERFKYI